MKGDSRFVALLQRAGVPLIWLKVSGSPSLVWWVEVVLMTVDGSGRRNRSGWRMLRR